MFENHNCTGCSLHNYTPFVCLQGKGKTDTAKMAVFLDYPPYMDAIRHKPFVSEEGSIVTFMLESMGLDVERDVRLDYVIKCWVKKKQFPSQKRDRLVCIEACSTYRFATLQSMPNLKSVVAMGRTTLEAFNGSSDIGEFEGECWEPREPFIRDMGLHHIWYTYSPAYIREKPGEAPGMYRILFTAAQEAGLDPQWRRVPFNWPAKDK